jgi:hypothetical protein
MYYPCSAQHTMHQATGLKRVQITLRYANCTNTALNVVSTPAYSASDFWLGIN